MLRTRIRVITHLSNLSVFDGWLGFNEFADQFGIIHPELTGAPGAIRTPGLWFRGPAPVEYVFDSSSSVMQAESAFCLVFGGFRTVLGHNFFFGVWQGASVSERISGAQIP